MAKKCICDSADIHLPVRSIFVVFPKSQRFEGYITNKLPNISKCIADIHTNWSWFIYFDEVYIQTRRYHDGNIVYNVYMY